jgi:hypothetical protein
MKYQVGDKVLLLHSNEEGEVVDIINDEMMLVDVDGVKFPVYMDQVDFPYFRRFSEKKLFAPPKEKKYVDDLQKEKPSPTAKVADGVWLTFLPVMDMDDPVSYRDGDEVVSELKLHLVNRTHTAYHFKYRQNFFGKPEFELNNQVNPFEDFYLHDIAFADLNDNPVFEFEFTLAEPDKKKADFYESSLRLKAKQLFARIKELKEKNEATFSYKLFETYPAKKIEDKFEIDSPGTKGYKVFDAKKARQHIEPARSIIDLHIEKLSDDWKHLSNYEIMSLQLKTFEKYYDLAVAHIQPSLTVIHGIGEGTLRNALHDILRLKKEVKSFVNQYHPLYGYGATEIFFQY